MDAVADPAPPTQDDRAELARRLLSLPVDELRQAANFIVGWAFYRWAEDREMITVPPRV